MRRCTLGTVLTWCWMAGFGGWGLAPLPAAAQEAGDEAAEADATETGTEVGQAEDGSRPGVGDRDRSGRRKGRDELARIRKLHELMRKEIRLRDEQIGPINRLFENHLEALTALSKEREAKRRANAARLEELEQEIAAARKDGDRETVRRLRREHRELSGAAGRLMELHRSFHAEVTEELDQEQGKAFRALARRVMFGRPERSSRLRDIQTLRRALRELDLSPEQKEATRRHFSGLREKLTEARPQGEEAIGKVVDELREAVLGELNEEQIARFEQTEQQIRKELERQFRRGRPRDTEGDRRRPDSDAEPRETPSETEHPGRDQADDSPDD